VAEQQAASGVVLGRGERSRGGYIPGTYRAADEALDGDDAEARPRQTLLATSSSAL